LREQTRKKGREEYSCFEDAVVLRTLLRSKSCSLKKRRKEEGERERQLDASAYARK
jgi:hypothetical protein